MEPPARPAQPRNTWVSFTVESGKPAIAWLQTSIFQEFKAELIRERVAEARIDPCRTGERIDRVIRLLWEWYTYTERGYQPTIAYNVNKLWLPALQWTGTLDTASQVYWEAYPTLFFGQTVQLRLNGQNQIDPRGKLTRLTLCRWEVRNGYFDGLFKQVEAPGQSSEELTLHRFTLDQARRTMVLSASQLQRNAWSVSLHP